MSETESNWIVERARAINTEIHEPTIFDYRILSEYVSISTHFDHQDFVKDYDEIAPKSEIEEARCLAHNFVLYHAHTAIIPTRLTLPCGTPADATHSLETKFGTKLSESERGIVTDYAEQMISIFEEYRLEAAQKVNGSLWRPVVSSASVGVASFLASAVSFNYLIATTAGLATAGAIGIGMALTENRYRNVAIALATNAHQLFSGLKEGHTQASIAYEQKVNPDLR